MPCISLQLLIGYFLSLEWSQGSWKSRSDPKKAVQDGCFRIGIARSVWWEIDRFLSNEYENLFAVHVHM